LKNVQEQIPPPVIHFLGYALLVTISALKESDYLIIYSNNNIMKVALTKYDE
jgi:hypothetical protein